MKNVLSEIQFQTARSGGAGGQNVNKVETMVEGAFHVASSQLLSDVEKEIVQKKLAGKINQDGYLKVRNQTERSQLANKEKVIKKIHALLHEALKPTKKRKATVPTLASRMKRLKQKKVQADLKESRRKINRYD